MPPDDRGFPSETENQRLFEIEDIAERLAGERAIFVGALSTASMRELIFYTNQSEWIAAYHRDLQHAVAGHEVQMMAQQDPEWNTYFTFMN